KKAAHAGRAEQKRAGGTPGGTPPGTPAGTPAGPDPMGGPRPTAGRSRVGVAPAAAQEVVWARGDGALVRVQLVVGDITEQAVDAIVNSSNRGLFGKAGVDGAIHRRGGPQLTEATRSIGGIDYGQAVFTPGFALPTTYVIHTATPPWGATGDELSTLARCYQEVFDLAGQLGVRSIALPAIGTGTYRYPVAEAARVAVEQAQAWVMG